jgi:penicillin-insensitive murein endopeptidase
MDKIYNIIIFIITLSLAGKAQVSENKINNAENKTGTSSKLEKYINENTNNDLPSVSNGSVSEGKLINGKLFPFSGSNFHYFDTLSYLNNRAFLNNKIKDAVVETYNELKKEIPERQFCIMECSNKNGGKIFPHRTHQNGLSIDFMVPLIKNQNPYYGLDSIGRKHYFLEFDEKGQYEFDKTISIDFDLIAKHILLLNEVLKKKKLRISKVIFKIELKDKLFATPNGQLLKKSEIYLAQNLTSIINSLHDDHYHIDFEAIK